jgi:5-methylcytosine-specific restriction enzyme subunit McrC
MNPETRVIELFEYEPQVLARRDLSVDAAQLIRDNFGGKVSVEPTSFRPDAGWKICSEGWVGYIPLEPDLGLRLSPKKGIAIRSIFRMLEYAYDIKSFQLQDSLIDCQFCEDLFEMLAEILAKRVLDRGKRGYYRAYQPLSDHLSCVRGRIDLKEACVAPWQSMPFCHFEEHTSDVEENRILAWALAQILRSGICSHRTLPTIRQAYHRLAQFAEIKPCLPSACVGRVYNRLNYDYEPMHALCRFFLDSSGPSQNAGDRKMMPFLVNTSSLYELFVARWLKKNLDDQRYSVKSQEMVLIDPNLNINFRIDLSIFDRESQSCAFVIDTKYKVGNPKTEDIEQVAAYAEAKGCTEAILVYPECSGPRLHGRIGKINVASAAFSLLEGPEKAGRRFVEESLGIGLR